MNTTRITDLTVDELMEKLRELVREAVREALAEGDPKPNKTKREPLDLPVLDVGPWPEKLSLRREDMYDDDGR